MAYRRKDEGGFWTSWGVIVALFILGLSPVALALMLVKLFKTDRREMEEIPSLSAETHYSIETPGRKKVDTRVNSPQQAQNPGQNQQGWQNQQGRQGWQNQQGQQGWQNQQGQQGWQNQQGRQGWQNQQGRQGWQNQQGRQGWQNQQGRQGWQNQQGWQGWQGSRPMGVMRQITRSPAPKKSTITGLTIGGGILAVIGFLSIDGLLAGFTFGSLMKVLSFLLGGGAMLLKSFLLKKDGKRYARYLPIIADREAVSVEELAKASGESVKQVERDLEEMVEKGVFGGGAYLNRELGYLFRSNEADRAWQEQQGAARASASPEVGEGYAAILRNIRRANDEIADPGLSAKIEQLEDITARIFRAVEEDPKKAEKIDTFLNYYLPTTQKLLDSYAQFEAAGVEGENLSQAKARISSTMDMILQGFSRQLDQLYRADAMDVDTDIRVMESMLRRDTRTVADDFYGGQSGTASGGGNAASGGTVSGGGNAASGGGNATSSGTVSGGTASGGGKNAASGGTVSGSGNAASGGGKTASGGKSARFGLSFEEDFGSSIAAQRAPEDQ